jgi:YlmC/YmxH family sporulation protein
MACTTDALSCKIVIRLCDGKRLGYICNYEIDTCDGKITAIFVPSEGSRKLLSRTPELRIPWCKISKIGEDAILVDIAPNVGECTCQNPARKKWWSVF